MPPKGTKRGHRTRQRSARSKFIRALQSKRREAQTARVSIQQPPSMQPEDILYFYVSFGHLLIRCVAMCLCAAKIHEESKQPIAVLFSVPTESFSLEVQRFSSQVATDHIALTGLKFFSVTKSLLLTVVGTIVTYEIVLMQTKVTIDEVVEGVTSSNLTRGAVNPYCPNKTTHFYL